MERLFELVYPRRGRYTTVRGRAEYVLWTRSATYRAWYWRTRSQAA